MIFHSNFPKWDAFSWVMLAAPLPLLCRSHSSSEQPDNPKVHWNDKLSWQSFLLNKFHERVCVLNGLGLGGGVRHGRKHPPKQPLTHQAQHTDTIVQRTSIITTEYTTFYVFISFCRLKAFIPKHIILCIQGNIQQGRGRANWTRRETWIFLSQMF